MAAIVFQTDKRSGITYAYESHSYWDKEKKQSRAKRRLIGRVDKTTGKIVPTDGRCRKKKNKSVNGDNNIINTLPIQNVKRRFYGATYLLDAIGDKLGIIDKLKKCFPDSYKQILSIVYYLILEENSALFRFEKWSLLHKHPYDDNISSQRISELFASIDEYSKHKFFKLWGKDKAENEFWAYDITSISSYSEHLKQIQYGYNKENDNLAQLNLAVVFGSSSNLPFYYRKLAGNIPDVKTVCNLLEELKMLDFSKIKLVMDRGFFSSANVNELYRHHLKFLLSARMSLKFVQKTLDGIYDTFRSFENYNPDYELYAHTVTTTWDYKHKRPYKKDTVKEKRRIYVHYYYNIEKAAEDEKVLNKRLTELRDELLSNKRVKEHERLYEKYFEIKKSRNGKVTVSVKESVIEQMKRYYGFFVLISNEKLDAIEALKIYRNKDIVEKAFGNLKDRLNMRRLLVSSEKSLEGKLFVAFVALIYLSYIKKQMQEKGLFKKYTVGTLLDKLDVIECFEANGYKLHVGEILKKQEQIYIDLNVKPPNSL